MSNEIIPPTQEFVDKLREPILILLKDEIEFLEELLGMELIYGVRDEHPGKYCVSRLALAAALFNSAEHGKRLAVLFDDKTFEPEGFGLIDLLPEYNNESLEWAKKVQSSKPLEVLSKLAKGELVLEDFAAGDE